VLVNLAYFYGALLQLWQKYILINASNDVGHSRSQPICLDITTSSHMKIIGLVCVLLDVLVLIAILQ